jgi:hypothetical protein
MGIAKRMLEEKQDQEVWALGVLERFKAISTCENHEDTYFDNMDEEAMVEAAEWARSHPPAGLTPEAAAALVRDGVHQVGDECPTCAKNFGAD